MANLLHYTGGVKTQGNLPESWTAPANLFDSPIRTDTGIGSFAAATSTYTAPASDLPDSILLVAYYQYEDTSNGRYNPQGKFVQLTGTGNFVSGPTGGYDRDTSEDRAYVRCFGVVNSPSASSTYQFQWKADADDATGGTVRSEFWAIPLYHSNIGMYTSASTSLYGGTTPNQVTGWSVVHESDTAAIELVSNVVTLKTDNKDYLVLGSQFFEGRGGRTQRWHGLEIDNTQENAAKAYSYYRNTSNDESGEFFTWPIRRSTTDITVEQTCYRGDGVANGQGGADADGSTPSVGDHSLVIIEWNDSAEVFRSTGSTNQNIATPGPVDIQATLVADIDYNDSGSFTRSSDTAINAEVAMDFLGGANISAASENVGSGSRLTAAAHFTVNGTEDLNSEAGDYFRGNQGSIDTFGWSANLLGVQALSLGDDIGISVTELPGTEGGGGAVHVQAGWAGFWGVNLDTLQAAGSTVTLSGTVDSQSSGVTGSVERVITASGSIQAASSGITGNVSNTVIQSLSGTVGSQSAGVTGQVERAITLSGTIQSGFSDVTGQLERVVVLSGSLPAGVAGLSGDIERVITLSGTLPSEVSGITGNVLSPITLSGTISPDTAALTGSISSETAVTLSGAIQAQNADVLGDNVVSAQSAGISGSVVVNATTITLSGTLSGSSSDITGEVERAVVLSGSVQASPPELYSDNIVNADSAGVSGTVNVQSNTVTLSGTISAPNAAITGDLERVISLSGSLNALGSTVAGDIANAITLSGVIQADSADLQGDNVVNAESAGITGTINVQTGVVTISGSLVGADSSISGNLERVVTLSGILGADAADLSGDIDRVVTLAGTVSAQTSQLTGEVERVVTLSGAVSADTSDVSGSVKRILEIQGTVAADNAELSGDLSKVFADISVSLISVVYESGVAASSSIDSDGQSISSGIQEVFSEISLITDYPIGLSSTLDQDGNSAESPIDETESMMGLIYQSGESVTSPVSEPGISLSREL